MAITESELKKQLREEPARLYFLYGEETYLTAHYAAQIARKAVGEDDLGGFNLQKFDGRRPPLTRSRRRPKALPLMAPRKCVVVRVTTWRRPGRRTIG